MSSGTQSPHRGGKSAGTVTIQRAWRMANRAGLGRLACGRRGRSIAQFSFATPVKYRRKTGGRWYRSGGNSPEKRIQSPDQASWGHRSVSLQQCGESSNPVLLDVTGIESEAGDSTGIERSFERAMHRLCLFRIFCQDKTDIRDAIIAGTAGTNRPVVPAPKLANKLLS